MTTDNPTVEEAHADARARRLQGADARPAPPTPTLVGRVVDQSPGAGHAALDRRHGHDRRRHATPTPTPTPDADPDADAMRVAVLAGGRSSEHEVSLNSAARGARGRRRRRARGRCAVTIERAGAWVTTARRCSLRPGGGLLGADAVFPVLHGPFGEDGTRPGPARAARRALRRRGRARLRRCAWTRSCSRRCWPRPACPQVALRGACAQARWRAEPDGRPARAGGARHAGVRQAGAARLLGRHRQGVVGGRAGPGARRARSRTTAW